MGINYGRAKGQSKLVNRVENNRNMKRAGCVSTVGRPVMINPKGRCCCKKNDWKKCQNARGKTVYILGKVCKSPLKSA